MVFVDLYLKLASVVILISSSYAKPFLYNSSNTLSLVRTTSTTPPQPSNIADLRESKVGQLSKLQESENEDQSFFDDVNKVSTPNRVISGIIQNKISKIFAKLQVLSSLSSNNNYGTNNNTMFNDETFSVATNNSVLSRGNYSIEQFERLKNSEDVINSVPPTLNFVPITLPRIFQSIVHLAYKMLSSPPTKDIVLDAH